MIIRLDQFSFHPSILSSDSTLRWNKVVRVLVLRLAHVVHRSG